MLEKLRIASLSVVRSMPKHVDAKAWEAASSDFSGAFDGLGATCTDVPPSDLPDLPILHHSYVRLVELLEPADSK